ncbi:MAG: PIN domain-containing protein [Candidatus Acidiferrales bacterium]
MSVRRLVDTNLILRHLVQDHPAHARAAGKLFEACDQGDLVIVLVSAVLAECLFVLESFYEHERVDISSALSTLISSPGVEINDRAVHLDALYRYRTTSLHFVDCLVAAAASAAKLPVASFDRGFRKFSDVSVEIE